MLYFIEVVLVMVSVRSRNHKTYTYILYVSKIIFFLKTVGYSFSSYMISKTILNLFNNLEKLSKRNHYQLLLKNWERTRALLGDLCYVLLLVYCVLNHILLETTASSPEKYRPKYLLVVHRWFIYVYKTIESSDRQFSR